MLPCQIKSNKSKPINYYYYFNVLQISWPTCLQQWLQFHSGQYSEPILFRTNVRISGKLRSVLAPMHVARSFSQRLTANGKTFRACVRNFKLVIDIHISDEHVTAGIALSPSSAALRGHLHGLRSTTASAMAMCFKMNDINYQEPSYNFILDPMCGKGSLLREFSHFSIIGSDIDEKQISIAKCNVPHAQFLISDACNLHIKCGYIDYIVCD